jgi:hypothetical protein
MGLTEARSRFSHREPGEGIVNHNVIGEGRPQPYDEPVTAEIPRQSDRELARPLRRQQREPEASGPRGRTGRRTVNKEFERPEDQPQERFARFKEKVRPVYSDRGESWRSANACAADLRARQSPDSKTFIWPNTVMRAMREGLPVAGRRLSHSPFPSQQEVA